VHVLWKPDPAGRDQLRASLTRSYRSPPLSNLIARPSINTRYLPPLDNTPTQPDRAGNPQLRPELATGLDLAFEHYLPAGGLISANVFERRISDYMRSVTTLENNVSWSATPRWVSRTRNVGNAVTRGLELEAKFRLSTLLDGAPNVDWRANASLFRSSVEGIPGPENRIDQQPDWTANLGADYRVPGTPFTLGASLNYTPGYVTRISTEQTATVNAKVIADAYGLWSVSPTFQIRLTASNLVPRDYLTGGSFDDVLARESTLTASPTYINVQLRLEFKL
jgi:iron complex outermembrane receptor protein